MVILLTFGDWFKQISIGDTITGICGIIVIIGAMIRVAQWFHKKNVTEVNKLRADVVMNRTENKTLTKGVTDQLQIHAKDDDRRFESSDRRFESIDHSFKELYKLAYDMNGKVTMLAQHFLEKGKSE